MAAFLTGFDAVETAELLVTAIELPREQFKAWCTRKLARRASEGAEAPRENWWPERGWDEYVDTDEALADVVFYVVAGQGPR